MKILITGYKGFVGRHLVEKLEELGHEVFGTEEMRNDEEGFLINIEKRPGPFTWGISQFDVVVHLAANIKNIDDRMNGGIAMFEDVILDYEFCKLMEALPPKKCLVLLSSCAVDFPEDPYCMVKRMLEAFASKLVKKGVPVVLLRPFSGYGADQSEEYPFRAIMDRAIRYENPLVVWGGSQVRDWIHIDDLVDAIIYGMDNFPIDATPVEIGTGIGKSISSLASRMAEAVGYNPQIKGDKTKAESSARRVADALKTYRLYGWEAKTILHDGISMELAKRLSQIER
jgi:UDP-glucose 4-epimerase